METVINMAKKTENETVLYITCGICAASLIIIFIVLYIVHKIRGIDQNITEARALIKDPNEMPLIDIVDEESAEEKQSKEQQEQTTEQKQQEQEEESYKTFCIN